MQYKIPTKQNIVLGTLVGIIFISVIFLLSTQNNPFREVPAAMAVKPPVSQMQEQKIGLPVRLKIPKINLDSAIEFVGLTEDGAMDIPKDANNVGWYESGVHPGEIGSSVFAGHYGWRDGKVSAFDNLHKLQKGDTVYVEGDTGSVVSFVVREIRSYEPDSNTVEVFSSNDGLAHLNLITCQGVWNKDTQSYSQRLIVFTDRKID